MQPKNVPTCLSITLFLTSKSISGKSLGVALKMLQIIMGLDLVNDRNTEVCKDCGALFNGFQLVPDDLLCKLFHLPQDG